MVISSNVVYSLVIHEMSLTLAVATAEPALMVMGVAWLLAIMTSVWPLVDSWFTVGTISKLLACAGGIGCSSAIHGRRSSGAEDV